jgi:hypothetical protein
VSDVDAALSVLGIGFGFAFLVFFVGTALLGLVEWVRRILGY